MAELNGSGTWTRGYVYLGGQMLAVQGGAGGVVSWVHQDPVTKSQRITNSSGAVVSTIDLDPWGGETGRSSNQAFQPHRYTTYERDANGGDEAMMRRYQSSFTRFSQPDPYDGSYNLGDPQSFNRYAYVQNDPVNFVDPSGLLPCYDAWCGSGGGSGWGGGYSGGNGWGSDPRPGRDIINPRFMADVRYTARWRWIEYTDGEGEAHTYGWWERSWQSHGYTSFGGNSFIQIRDRQEPTRPTPSRPQPRQPREDPCVTSPYVNFGLSGGAFLFGGSVSLLASSRGFYLQFGGGAATPQGRRIGRLGASPIIRVSRSGITDGWGKTLDFTYYARNYDSSGNLVSQEGGFVGLPGASAQSTYTFRILNHNNCK